MKIIVWQKPGVRPILRAISLVTVFVFTVTSTVGPQTLALANPAPKPVMASSQVEAVAKPISHLMDDVKLSESIGEIKKSYKGSRDQIVIHIQDAHANEEVQYNIANILDYFAKEYELKLINLEGAEGELFTELFSIFPHKTARKNVADYFVKQGRLTGPEYLAIVNRPDLILNGVEDREIYQRNREAYFLALEHKEEDEEILTNLGQILDTVSRFIFTSETRSLIQHRQAFHDEHRELISYVRYLMELTKKYQVSLGDYPQIESLSSLLSLEANIDFDKANQEMDTLFPVVQSPA